MANITKQEAINRFFAGTSEEEFGTWDKVKQRCAWIDHVDMLEKEGEVTRAQSDRWSNPFA